MFEQPLLAAPQAGPFSGQFLFDAKSLKLAAGDTVTYWAAAADNKSPDANRVETDRYLIRIVAPRDGAGKQQQKDGKGADQPPAGQQHADGNKPPDRDPNDNKRDKRDNPADKDEERKPEERNGQQRDQADREPKNNRTGDTPEADQNPPGAAARWAGK